MFCRKLERYLQDRQTNLTLLSTLKANNNDASTNEYIESIQSNIDYLTKCIEVCQATITQLTDDGGFTADQYLTGSLSAEEAAYIVSKLTATATNYALSASHKDEELKAVKAQQHAFSNYNDLYDQDGYNLQQQLMPLPLGRSGHLPAENGANGRTAMAGHHQPAPADQLLDDQLTDFDTSHINFRRGSSIHHCTDCAACSFLKEEEDDF